MRRILLLAFIFFCCHLTFAQTSLRGPLIWNVDNIEHLRNDPTSKTYKDILKKSDKYCRLNPISVFDKKQSLVDDFHYYVSVGGYWWPDSLVSGKYVHRDGVRNPWSKEFDSHLLSEFLTRCKYFSVAYYLTHDKRYYESYIKQIKAWFLDEDTYMYPNMKYASVVPQSGKLSGRSSGMIQAYSFVGIIESILLINSISKIDDEIVDGVKKWFREFIEWAENGSVGKSLRKSTNNIGLAYDVILIDMLLFVGDDIKAKEISNSFARKRLYPQIDKDGKQEAELKRTLAFSYSLFNLTHILDFCFLNSYWDVDYYSEHQEIIDKAIDFLQQYEDRIDDFPYSQISDNGKCNQQLKLLLQRRNRLRGNSQNLTDIFQEPLSVDLLLNLLFTNG